MAERKLADDSGEDQHTGRMAAIPGTRTRRHQGAERRSRVSRTQRERPWGVLSHWSLLIS